METRLKKEIRAIRRCGACLLIVSGLCISTSVVHAQQTPPPADSAKQAVPKAPDRWAAAVDLGFNAATGNTRLVLLSTGFRLRHRETKEFKLEWGVSFQYGESRGTVVARSLRSNLVFDLYPESDWAPYAFATIERDPFRRLALRSNTGSGITHTFHNADKGELSISAAALYSHEGFTVATQPSRNDARWSVESRGQQTIGSNMTIENTSSFKPVWDHAGDYNIQSVTKLSSKITQRLAMTLSHEYLKDSTPPDGVRQEDQRVKAGLTFEF
jgi:putative salt-induced outer membrane protein YdiY